MKFRGLIHFHSCYSYDSVLSIKKIINFALNNNLNFLCLTDHETIEGAQELKKYVEKYNLPIKIIIGAEYKTSLGDVIALNIKSNIKSMEFDEFVKEVKGQGGILLFPHPYKGHKEIEKIAQHVDRIEIFNSRVDKKNNKKAFKLAKKYNKNTYCASDAHTFLSLKNCILEFESEKTSFIKALSNAHITCLNCKNSFYFEIIYSQLIKSIKYRSFLLFFSQVKQFIKLCLTFRLFRRIS